ncbi:hypothetical protein RB195_005891 [Necator americanus]
MSEGAATTPSVIAENGEKSAGGEATMKMAEMKIQDTEETAEQPSETDQDAKIDPRENGDDGFHTPEATDEGQKEGSAKLDDDEIEDNPAYIPRKGRYYMHDSRDAEEEVEEEKKTSRADGTWKHDRFDERWQRPKTKKQIMTRYGFDIREGETQEEAEENQRKRTAEKAKKETTEESELMGEKRRAKKTTRAKPRPRVEKTQNTPAKVRPQRVQKQEKQSNDERPLQEGEDRVANARREDDDDDDVHVGQRRQVRPEHRRDRHDRTDVRVVRNVRGSRGGLSGHRLERHAPMKDRYDRDRYRDHDNGYRREQRHEERHYENHRRGVMRGSVRGASSYTRGQPSRTFTASHADSRESGYQREEVPPQRNAGYSPRALDNGAYYDNRGGYAPRGGYAGRGRGGIAASPRGGYSPRGDTYPTRGFTGPKRYSEQRGEIIPPPVQMAVPPPPLPPPQHNFSIPRQPTDVVYFDPTQQPSRQPLPPREKKIIEIVPPSN